MPISLYVKRNVPFELTDVHLLGAKDEQLLQISRELGVALNLEEMRSIQGHFSRKGRDPTDAELQTFGQTWSEHCFHKTFKGKIISEDGKPIVDNMFKEYIAKVTKELDLPWCLSVFEDNAGIVDFEDGYAIAAKVETHNHPSAIEPFGGAATGTGGVIRDILGVWADPVACTDVLCFGPSDYPYDKLPAGTKHPKYLFRGVVAGIGHYGNNMGIPTVNGAIYFDKSYVSNVVVYCGCIGILPIDTFVKDTRPGDIAILAGGRTGKDGIHGVTFASAELTAESEEVSRPAVQIANPIEEEKLKRAIIRIRDQKLASAITDLGAGGISCAVGEMAHRSNCGAHVQLEEVPLKHPDIAPWEIHVSESQERMLLSIRKKHLQQVLAIFKTEDVEATAIGSFTGDKVFKVDYQEHNVVNLDLHFLFTPPRIRRTAKRKPQKLTEPSIAETVDLTKDLLGIISSPNIASKESVVRSYDHEVKGNTVLKPLHGRHGGPNDAAVIKPLASSWRGVVISCGINPSYGKIDPYWMAASAIDEAIRNNVSVGGRRISLLDNFTWGNPEKPDRLGGLLRACRACYDFAKAFGTPFISGKDSLYNESPTGQATPTLLITAIGIIPDVRKTVSVDVKKPGNLVYLISQTYPELGGSEYYRLKGYLGKTVPQVRMSQARRTINSLTKAIDSGLVESCHDLSEGGLAVTAAEMTFSEDCGIELNLRDVPKSRFMKRNDYIMFSESNSRFLIEVAVRHREDFEKSMKGCVYAPVGETRKERDFSIHGVEGDQVVDVRTNVLRDAWKSALRGRT
ncbi:MAG: phosphoribosylformylglycinamidine synthase subunit PurL [Candidatus Bathyarchaeota archaeon]|nr:MAG: phosphoribosylformylglycinamidine synthase subunit PurL [Candidatus Bathyarchaeota archaeon]